MFAFDDLVIERLFGADDAENERPERFKQYFYKSRSYESLTSGLPVRVLVGHKGVGKSALLKRAFLEDIDRGRACLWLKANELLESHDDISRPAKPNFRIEAWKRAILWEAMSQFLVKLYGEGALSAVPEAAKSKPKEMLKLLVKGLDEKARSEGQRGSEVTISIYIDDIDRGWSATPDDIASISALLNAIRDIGGEEQRLLFRIGLRSDVYFLVRTSDESTDKIERNVIWLRWSNDDILRIAAKRIVTFFELPYTQEKIASLPQLQITNSILSRVIEPRFSGKGKWNDWPTHRVLMSMTRGRPRDLVKLFHGAAKRAYVHDAAIIRTSHLQETFEGYSQERLQDIINEFKSELPKIDQLLFKMKPSKKGRKTSESFQFSTATLSSKLRDIMSQVNLNFSYRNVVSPRSLIQFLYKIDFITARKLINGEIDRKYFDESRFLASEFVEFGYDWEIHPAYRWALQPQDIQDVIDSIAS